MIKSCVELNKVSESVKREPVCMSQKLENLSALVDGEISQTDGHAINSINALQQDSEMLQKWHNYHLIRYGLRKELPTNLHIDIAANVALALAAEPTILAPKKGFRDLPVVAAVLPFIRQGGQLAIAASVAVAVIVGVQQVNNSPEIDKPFNSAAPILGVPGGLSPVSFEQSYAVPQNNEVEQRRKINAYLADHQQQMRLKTIKLADNPTSTPVQSLETSETQSDVTDETP
jgi:sigma-E factor negative regulatory protein RseA